MVLIKSSGWAGAAAAVLVAGVAVTVPVAADAAPVRAASCTATYTQTADHEVSVGVADDPSVLTVPAWVGPALDVDVRVEVDHPNDQEVDLTLFHGGDAVTLVSGVGGSGDDFAGTVLDDEAPVALASGAPPFTGRFQPIQPLAAFDGDPSAGTWELLAKDNSVGPGTLLEWSVVLTLAVCDQDGDTRADGQDACPALAAASASGCPVAVVSVGSRYRNGAFRGTIGASAPACEAHRKVVVRRVQRGPDPRVARVRSKDSGRYVVKAPARAGRYRVAVPATVVPGIAECPAVQSRMVRIR